MPFGLTNTPATFQSYIDDCQSPYIDDFAVCYLDNKLMYSAHQKEHEEHVGQVLQRLKEFGLYWKADKCQFGVSEVGFQGFVITPDGVGMELDRISTIEDWPTLWPVRDVQVLLGFMNFYWRFIRKYAKVTLPLTELLKKSETSCGKISEGSAKWECTREAKLAFRNLTRTFTETPILQNFDLAKPIILQMDATGFAISGILNQYDVSVVLRPASFYSRKSSPAEHNYDTYDRELLAIVEILKQWRHYLKGTNYKVLIRCDHMNLEYLQTSKVLSSWQARWSEILRLTTLSSSTWKAARTRPMAHPDGPIMRSATNGLWHDYWQLSQWNYTTIPCQQSLRPTLPTRWLSTSRWSLSTNQW